MAQDANDRRDPGAKPNRRYIIWPLAYIFLAVVFAVAASAWNGPGGMRGHGMFGRHHSPPDAEAMRDRVAFGIEWGLRKLDATPEQQEQIQAIAADAVDRMVVLHERHGASKAALRDLITAEQVDRLALETWRVEQLASLDEGTKQLAESVANALDVLTPEQRAELAEHMARHQH